MITVLNVLAVVTIGYVLAGVFMEVSLEHAFCSKNEGGVKGKS